MPQIGRHLQYCVYTGLAVVFLGSAAFAQPVSGSIDLLSKKYSTGTLGLELNVYNNGTRISTLLAYGFRVTYTNTTAGQTMYDIGSAFHNVWQVAPGPVGAQMFGQWIIAEGPSDSTKTWGIVGGEINVVNRGDDTGWTDFRGHLPRFSAGLQLAPESNTFSHGGTPQHITAGLVIGHSAGTRSDGMYIGNYSGVLIEPNSIAPGGRAFTVTGDTLAGIQVTSNTPAAIATLLGGFMQGFNSTKANIADTVAYRMASSQTIGWERADGQQTAKVGSDEAGNIRLNPAGTGGIVLVIGGVPKTLTVGAPDSGGPGLRSLAIPN